MRRKKTMGTAEKTRPGTLSQQRDALRRRVAHLEEHHAQKDVDVKTAQDLADRRLHQLIEAEQREARLNDVVKALKTLLVAGESFASGGAMTSAAFLFDEGSKQWRKA